MKLNSLVALLCCVGLACTQDPSGRLPVAVTLQVQSIASPRDFAREDGFQIHLDQATLLLGPLYLRAPKRKAQSSLMRLMFPVALAHGTHAQTLTEGQVIGELLEQTAIDALSEATSDLDTILVEPERLDRISVMLDEPRDPTQSKRTRGYHAFVEGTATRDGQRVPFACGLTIGGDDDESPENLEARRRVDQVLVPGSPQLDAPATLTLVLDVRRWLEFVDFSAMQPDVNPCEGTPNLMLSQWYLGIRRPEAFSVRFKAGT